MTMTRISSLYFLVFSAKNPNNSDPMMEVITQQEANMETSEGE